MLAVESAGIELRIVIIFSLNALFLYGCGKLLQVGALSEILNFIGKISCCGGEDHLMQTILKSVICKTALWPTVYHLWQLKNSILHQGKINSEEFIIRTIKWEVKERVESKGGFCNSLLNRALCCSWGISRFL